MRIPRVFDPQPLALDQEITLGDFAAQHLGRALRMKPGDALVLFNGEGGEYPAVLTSVSKKQVRAQIQGFTDCRPDSPLSVHLGQGISRGERMDYCVQKSTELGVSAITPLFSRRCEVRLNAERRAKRVQHWQQVAISASEQSGRCRVPELIDAVSLEYWLGSVKADLKLILDPGAPRPLESLERPDSVALLIGPEGGLADDELAAATQAGFLPVALGPRVLRTETAPVVALTLLQYLWGDIGTRE